MLKAQLKSKIFQLDLKWEENEDILTGDFFGVLDYLPRNPYLYNFISYIGSLNPNVQTPPTNGVDWENTEIRFWPRLSGEEEGAEPDLIIISNKWILVIEVKLQSNFGDTQPWREYVVGCKIAQEHSISMDSVFYLVLARKRLDIAQMFNANEAEKLNKLAARTHYLKWHEAVALVESWLRNSLADYVLASEHKRILTDLFWTMKRRRAIAFSGFTFTNIPPTAILAETLFCPPRFEGFQRQALEIKPAEDTVFLGSCHTGFVSRCQDVDCIEQPVFLGSRFDGFLENLYTAVQTYDSIYFSSQFPGFLRTVPSCEKCEYLFRKGLDQ